MAGNLLTFGISTIAALTLLSPTSWTATLEAKDGSQVGGSARIEAVGADSSRTTLQLTGAKPGSQLPWHVHQGACGTKGPVVGDPLSYPMLQVGPDGKAVGTLTMSSPPPAAGEYSVNVHRSAGDMTPIACGAFKPDGEVHTMPAMPKDTTTRP